MKQIKEKADDLGKQALLQCLMKQLIDVNSFSTCATLYWALYDTDFHIFDLPVDSVL